MIESVKAAVKRYNMFENEKSVTVALSGGADSVALLLALLEIKDEFSLTVSAAHLNHCLRGSESDGDEEFVRELCEKLSVPLFCERAEIAELSKNSGDSVELTARNVRYRFLERVSDGVIATAHTADDSLETMLYNMARGTGLKGVCGIPPVRDRIVRPLIFVSRQQVEEYCASKKVQYRTDSSNLSDIYARNKIRHRAVPTLKEVNSAAVKNAAVLSEHLRRDEELLQSIASETFQKCLTKEGLSIEALKAEPFALQYRCIAKLALLQINTTLEHKSIESVISLIEGAAKKQSVNNGCYVVNDNGVLRFLKPEVETEPFCFEVKELPFSRKGYTLSEVSIENPKESENFNNLFIENVIDCDKISGVLWFRSRNPGDTIKLRGRGCTKTFKNLFNEKKLKQSERDSLPVLCDNNGVLWLAGFGVDERAAVDDKTKTVILIEKTFS